MRCVWFNSMTHRSWRIVQWTSLVHVEFQRNFRIQKHFGCADELVSCEKWKEQLRKSQLIQAITCNPFFPAFTGKCAYVELNAFPLCPTRCTLPPFNRSTSLCWSYSMSEREQSASLLFRCARHFAQSSFRAVSGGTTFALGITLSMHLSWLNAATKPPTDTISNFFCSFVTDEIKCKWYTTLNGTLRQSLFNFNFNGIERSVSIGSVVVVDGVNVEWNIVSSEI